MLCLRQKLPMAHQRAVSATAMSSRRIRRFANILCLAQQLRRPLCSHIKFIRQWRFVMLERRSDRDLKQRIMRELKWDSRISWASINVEVTDGVVTLVGTVPTYGQKIAAEEVAHRVQGVLDVANDVEVRPIDRFM